jgi:hypothetical protein
VRTIALPGCGRRAAITDHAYERWAELVNWATPRPQAKVDMQRLAAENGVFMLAAPDWACWPHDGRGANTFGFVTCGDVCLVIAHARENERELVIATIITRGGLMPGERARRHRDSRERRYRTRSRARKSGGDRGPRGSDRRDRRDRIARDTDTRRWAE